jgi:uncharacterized repeat protein (TIGR03943 family)
MTRFSRYRIVYRIYILFIIYLLFTGDIFRFLAPHLVWLTYICSPLLGVFLIFVPSNCHEGCSHEGNSLSGKNSVPETAKLMFLLYPLLLFFIVNPQNITELNAPAIKFVTAKKSPQGSSHPATLDVEKDGYAHINLLGLRFIADGQPSLLKGYKFKVIGMVSKVFENKLSLQRIVMTCCAADAQPVEIDVSTDGGERFRKGDWLSVAGRVVVQRDRPTFIPDGLEKVSKPDDYYITMFETLTQLKIEEKPAAGCLQQLSSFLDKFHRFDSTFVLNPSNRQ